MEEKKPRKQRSDKGVPRAPYKSRGSKKDLLNVYYMVLGKIKRKAMRENISLVRRDQNFYYIPIESTYEKEYGSFKQSLVDEGVKREINHTVKYTRTQKPVDLEKYRFEAYQDKAMSSPDLMIPLPNIDMTGWLIELYGHTIKSAMATLSECKFTWKEFFCLFYHIKESEYDKWTYELWREHYERCPYTVFEDDFKFRIDAKPGSPDFMPEYAYKAQEVEEAKEKEAEDKKAIRAYAARCGQANRIKK